MINYRFDEEKDYLLYYAQRLDDTLTQNILNSGTVASSAEAEHLSRFFWRMVDTSIEDEKQKIQLPWPENAEFWNEKTMRSISGYLERAGYEAIWERVSDEQDE